MDRDPHAKSAGELIDALAGGLGKAFVAWHSISNFHYLVRPVRGPSVTKQFVLELLEFTEVAPTTTQSLREAIRFEMKDFEEAMQVATALACNADVIASRNIRDYSSSPVVARKPKDVLSQLL